MSLTTEWFIAATGIQIVVNLVFPDKIEQGIITRWMKKLFRLPKNTFFFFRTVQIIALCGFKYIYVAPYHISFYLPVIILYLDDYFFGDNDKWKRRWEAVKNKIKWKQYKPVPDGIT